MQSPTQRNAVIYCRVSTKEQAEDGGSLVTQERICREYAAKHGYTVIAIYVEEGESAKTTDRTQLKKLMAFCSAKKHNIKAVIAYKIDRISRNVDDYSYIRMFMRRYNVEIKSTSEYFEDTPSGRFMENILANVAQFDNDVRTERSVGGMKEAVRNGRYVWKAPIGYINTKVNGKSTIAPGQQAPLIQQAFKLVSQEKYTVEEVRGFLAANGLSISQSQFYITLRNELYAGWILKFGERIKGTFDPIVTDELFAKVQNVIISRRKKNQINKISNPDFPLRKFVRHTSGKSLTACWAQGRNKKYAYYFVKGEEINLPKSKAEEDFKNLLNNYSANPKYLEKIFDFVTRKLAEFKKTQLDTRTKINNKIAELKEKRTLLIDKNFSGVIDDELCKEKLSQISNQLFELEHTLSFSFDDMSFDSKAKDVIRTVLGRPGNLWMSVNTERKIALQWFFFPEGIVISKEGYQLPEVCSIFKLKGIVSQFISVEKNKTENTQGRTVENTCTIRTKGEISPYQSCYVHHSFSKSNTSIRRNLRPCQNENDINNSKFWIKLFEEIRILLQISINPKLSIPPKY